MKLFKLFLKNVALKVAVIGIAIFLLLQFVLGFHYYRGNDMFPNIKDGDFVVTWKLDPLQANDVVMYKAPSGKTRLGRVVAKGGDKVSFTDDGELRVNDSIVSEEVFYATTSTGNKVTYPDIVPADEYFILNDYRSVSEEDSRTYKSIAKQNINGRVILLFRRRGF